MPGKQSHNWGASRKQVASRRLADIRRDVFSASCFFFTLQAWMGRLCEFGAFWQERGKKLAGEGGRCVVALLIYGGLCGGLYHGAWAHDIDQRRLSTSQAEFVDAFNELCLATSANIAKINFKLSKPNPWHFKAVDSGPYSQSEAQELLYENASNTGYVLNVWPRDVFKGRDAHKRTTVRQQVAGIESFHASPPQVKRLSWGERVIKKRLKSLLGRDFLHVEERAEGEEGALVDHENGGEGEAAQSPEDGMPALPENVDISIVARGELVSLTRQNLKGDKSLYLVVDHHENSQAIELTCTLTASLPETNAHYLKDEARDKLALIGDYEDISSERRVWQKQDISGGKIILDLFSPHQGRRSVRLLLDLSTKK